MAILKKQPLKQKRFTQVFPVKKSILRYQKLNISNRHQQKLARRPNYFLRPRKCIMVIHDVIPCSIEEVFIDALHSIPIKVFEENHYDAFLIAEVEKSFRGFGKPEYVIGEFAANVYANVSCFQSTQAVLMTPEENDAYEYCLALDMQLRYRYY